MSKFKAFALATLAIGLFCCAHSAPAQISVTFGVEPVCPYGYYGPDWFVDGVFIGAGHWYHGRDHFYGHVVNRYDPRHGYHGPLPERGAEQFNHFHANEARDGRGHVGPAGHDGGGEHALPGFHGGGGGHGGHR